MNSPELLCKLLENSESDFRPGGQFWQSLGAHMFREPVTPHVLFHENGAVVHWRRHIHVTLVHLESPLLLPHEKACESIANETTWLLASRQFYSSV